MFEKFSNFALGDFRFRGQNFANHFEHQQALRCESESPKKMHRKKRS